MKKFTFAFYIAFSSYVFSQVGIGTNTPKVTLDIASDPLNKDLADGVLIPKLKGDELKEKDSNYNDDQHGTIVFVTEIPTELTTKTSEINSTGFYYYDSSKSLWVPISSNEPWNIRETDNMASLNSQDIYQNGNVAVGTKYGLGAFHVDGGKNNSSTSPSVTEMLDDFLVHPTGRVYIGAKPNDLLLLGGVEDKIKVASNNDLDVDYDLATTSKSQAIVHRSIISSGTMDNRGPRLRGTSISSFEGHTYQTPSLSNKFSWYQQRASIVLRTGKYSDDGGEIWFGTAGTSTNGESPKQAWYRAVMDEKGFWAFGADPNGEAYNYPTERLDVLFGGLRLRQLNTTAYTSTNNSDRIVVVDANGVLKTKIDNSSARTITNSINVQKVDRNAKISSITTLANASNGLITLEIGEDQEYDGNQLLIKKIDNTSNQVKITSTTNKKIDTSLDYLISNTMGGVTLQYFDNNWYVVSKL